MINMKKMIEQINNLFAELSGWFLIVMMFLIIIDFIGRGLYRPIHGVRELAIFVLIAVVYLGIPHCERVRGHVRVTVIVNRLTQKKRQLIITLVYIVTFLLIIIILFSVGRNFIHSCQSGEAIAGTVPLLIWPVKLSIVVGCFFYCIQVLINSVEEFKKLFNINTKDKC